MCVCVNICQSFQFQQLILPLSPQHQLSAHLFLVRQISRECFPNVQANLGIYLSGFRWNSLMRDSKTVKNRDQFNVTSLQHPKKTPRKTGKNKNERQKWKSWWFWNLESCASRKSQGRISKTWISNRPPSVSEDCGLSWLVRQLYCPRHFSFLASWTSRKKSSWTW